MTDLERFIDQAWTDHASDSPAVALRLPHAIDLVADEDGLVNLAHLAHHVYGDHLAQWADGLKYLAALARRPAFDAHGTSGAALLRYRASLGLAAGDGDVRGTLQTSDRIRVGAMAAAALAAHDAGRATGLLQEALEEARSASLPAGDPAFRSLAAGGNNLAASLQEKADLSPLERELMLLGARTGREYWERAGTWLEVERAEHRLAMCWLAAGDALRAREHAQACLEIVHGQAATPAEAPPLERFFGWVALGLAERAAGGGTGLVRACAEAQAAFDSLGADDQGWCRPSLDKLAA